MIPALGGVNVAMDNVGVPPPPLGVDNVLERQDLVLPIEEVADNVNEVNQAEIGVYVPPHVCGNGVGNGHQGIHNGHNGARNGGNGNANGNGNNHRHAAPRQQQQQQRGALAPAHQEEHLVSAKKKSVVHFDQEPCDKPKQQRYGYANPHKVDFVPNRIDRPIPRPVALNMALRRKVELTPPTARHVISRAKNHAPNKNVPRRLNFDNDQEGSTHQHTNEKPRDQVAYALAREAYLANPKPKQAMPHPMVPSTSKAISLDPLVPDEYVKFPTKPRSIRPGRELRPWLEERKEEYRSRFINQEVQRRQSYAIRKFQPRMVGPANGVPYGTWQRVEHPKFPSPPLQRNRKTWRRRELRKRAKARKEMEMNEELDKLNSTLQKSNVDGIEEGSSNGVLPTLKVTPGMSFEQLVAAGLEPWRAKVVLEQARLDEWEAKIKRKEAELDIRTNVLADMIIALNKARDEFNRQKSGDMDQDNYFDNKDNDVNVNALCENTNGEKKEVGLEIRSHGGRGIRPHVGRGIRPRNGREKRPKLHW
ncbi:hypothetical protein COLO4_36030 [Corchorus olitorius]|uniref:Uncharacterized protein n=1 Tax=Corchorus olitorius TaxID=93759 RepID=A0A1R3GB78_9ROSI|nr:hypothetical protein COLO4_36030 [Corchorus olitorius]